MNAYNFYRSWYILAFQAAILPELLLLSNDCEALDAGARTGPSAMKTDGAITVQEVERKGSSSKSCVLHALISAAHASLLSVHVIRGDPPAAEVSS